MKKVTLSFLTPLFFLFSFAMTFIRKKTSRRARGERGGRIEIFNYA